MDRRTQKDRLLTAEGRAPPLAHVGTHVIALRLIALHHFTDGFRLFLFVAQTGVKHAVGNHVIWALEKRGSLMIIPPLPHAVLQNSIDDKIR